MRFVSAVCIVSFLVRSVVRIHLIGPIVSVSLICLVIGIMQICPVIQLCFGMCFPDTFPIISLLSEPKKPTHFASCVDCDHPEDRFARNKTNPTKEHFLRFDFVVQSIETTGGQRQSTSKLLSQFHNENLIGINSFEDLLICLQNCLCLCRSI